MTPKDVSSHIAQDLEAFLPTEIGRLENDKTGIPRIARDPKLTRLIHARLRDIPTHHALYCHDSRFLDFLPDESVHLVVTSPPYWTLKEYRDSEGQLGHVEDYEEFLVELGKVWRHCFRVLVPGGRLIVVVGDVCLSRKNNGGRHMVVPLHASIQEQCRAIGFDNLAPIIWHKISNAAYEVEGGGGFLGKPYEPNAVIKNDIEFILMQRKAGGYRTPSLAARILSVISAEDHRVWFQQIWSGLTGASTKDHPAPYPVELAERLIRMFSFVGDTVLDPFGGTGSTTLAASRFGRNSVSVELDTEYFKLLKSRLAEAQSNFFSRACFSFHPASASESARNDPGQSRKQKETARPAGPRPSTGAPAVSRSVRRRSGISER
ncbi:MAG: DNA methyltransferase [Acidobacteria bacterium]|nr:DNA methyltransferase [Acidobacteriota bacterium]